MDIIQYLESEWYDTSLRDRLAGLADQEVAKRVLAAAEVVGSHAALLTLDAIDNFETPPPTAQYIAGRGLYIFYQGLSVPTGDRID